MKTLLYITVLCYGLSFAFLLIQGLSGRLRKDPLWGPSGLLLGAGFILHTAALIVRTASTGHAPMASIYETLLFYSWTVTLVSLIVRVRYSESTTGLITTPMAAGTLVFAFFNEVPGKTLTLILRTIWFEIHVTSSFASYALFTLAFSAALTYLIKKHLLPNSDGPEFEAELRKYERISSRSIMWGFLFFSASMFGGAIWGYLAWGAYWMWEPKIIWSFIVWFYYAGAMHAFFVGRWRGTGLSIATVIGIFIVLFTYLGVGLLMKSSHSF